MIKLKLDRNASKKIVAIALATTMTSGFFAGCSSKEKTNILDDTILENSRVITFEDGHIDIAVENNRDYSRAHEHEHIHYESIITGEWFTTSECDYPIYQYNIISDESIVAYLTPEEISKATIEGLTNEDIKNIISRIFTSHEEITQTSKTRELTK